MKILFPRREWPLQRSMAGKEILESSLKLDFPPNSVLSRRLESRELWEAMLDIGVSSCASFIVDT